MWKSFLGLTLWLVGTKGDAEFRAEATALV